MISPKEAKKFTKYLAASKPYHLNLPNGISAIVVIPVFKDFMILSALKSLAGTYTAKSSKIKPAVIIVLNHPENSDPETIKKNEHLSKILHNFSTPFPLEIIKAFNLPKKYAGVGYARKIGMDAASNYFFSNETHNGIIISLDADTVVSENYFDAIFNEFNNNEKINGVSIYYEHITPKNEKIKHAITQYELHLRYYVNMLRKIKFPFAFHTIGSAFAISYRAYLRQNGMPIIVNLLEDFYTAFGDRNPNLLKALGNHLF
jgi:hypothetical protein